MVQEAGGEQRCGIGARLCAAREKRGLTLLQAAEKLHVDARLLEALEAEDFAALGADVYVRGHLRRYAEAVGESAAQLQQLYVGAAPAAAPDLTRIARAEPAGESSRLMLPALAVVAGFGIAGLLWWVLSLQSETAQPLATVAPTFPESAAPAAAPATAAGRQTAAPPGAAAVSPDRRTAGASALSAQVTVQFSGVSWVAVSDADGRRLLEGLFAPGSARTLTGAAPLNVILGNAPAVTLQVNGRPVALAGLIHRDGSAHLLIDDTGRASHAPPRLAHGD